MSLPPQVYLKAVSLSGRKLHEPRIVVGEAPIEGVRLTLAFDGVAVRGQVSDNRSSSDDDGPILPGKVVLVPDGRKANYLTSSQTRYGADGSFAFTTVAPGRYRLYATAEHDPSELSNPELKTVLDKVVRLVEIESDRPANVEVPLIDAVIGID